MSNFQPVIGGIYYRQNVDCYVIFLGYGLTNNTKYLLLSMNTTFDPSKIYNLNIRNIDTVINYYYSLSEEECINCKLFNQGYAGSISKSLLKQLY